MSDLPTLNAFAGQIGTAAVLAVTERRHAWH